MKTNSEDIIKLSNDRIVLAGLLILLLGFFTWRSDLSIAKPLLIASLWMVVVLFLIGLMLVYIFSINHPLLVLLIGMIMLLVAGREVSARQKYSIKGLWSYDRNEFYVCFFVCGFNIWALGDH